MKGILEEGSLSKEEKALEAGGHCKGEKLQKMETFSLELIVCKRMKNIFFQLFFISTNFHFENIPSVNRFR